MDVDTPAKSSSAAATMPKSPRQQQQQQKKVGSGVGLSSIAQQQVLLPEIEAYLHLLVTVYLLDQKRLEDVSCFLFFFGLELIFNSILGREKR